MVKFVSTIVAVALSGCLFSSGADLPNLSGPDISDVRDAPDVSDAGDVADAKDADDGTRSDASDSGNSDGGMSCVCDDLPNENRIGVCVDGACQHVCAEEYLNCDDSPDCETEKGGDMCGCTVCEFATEQPNGSFGGCSQTNSEVCVIRCDAGYFSQDGNYETGCECARVDEFGDGRDADCDGVDGTAADAYFVDFGAMIDGDGTPASPAKEIVLTEIPNGKSVIVIRGNGQIPPTSDTSLKFFGGYDQNWMSSDTPSVITGPEGAPALSIGNLSDLTFHNFEFNQSKPIERDVALGATVRILSSNATFRKCKIVAADVDFVPSAAADGRDADGAPTAGSKPQQMNGGAGGGTGAFAGGRGGNGGKCANSVAPQNGQPFPNPPPTVPSPGMGGAAGMNSCLSGNPGAGTNGQIGAVGANATPEANDARFLEDDSTSPMRVKRYQNTLQPVGTRGQGGGGGGGGGAFGMAGAPTDEFPGQGGGGGGEGGYGGESGQAGMTGTSTVGVFVLGSSSVVTFEGGVIVELGIAGKGGKGGTGGCGGPGGAGGIPTNIPNIGGVGGAGGSGGYGGNGAHGTSGNGGLSIGVLALDNSTFKVNGNAEFRGGTAGAKGDVVAKRICENGVIEEGNGGHPGRVRAIEKR